MFQPTPEQELIRQTMREFAQTEVQKIAAKMDEEDWWPATESSVEPLDGLRPSGAGRCPPRVTPRAGAFGPRGPLKARAGALAEAA